MVNGENSQIQTLVGRQNSTLDNDVFDENCTVQDIHVQKSVLASKPNIPIASSRTSTRPKSVTFSQQNGKMNYPGKRSQSSVKSATRSGSKRSSYLSDSDNEDEAPPIPEVLPIKQDWRMPRFYVKPEDRHKSEDLFLMRRHALLQRQLAQGINPQRVTKNSQIEINSSFSIASRQSGLNKLVNENEKTLSNHKRVEHKHDVQVKVNKFLESLSTFLDENKRSET